MVDDKRCQFSLLSLIKDSPETIGSVNYYFRADKEGLTPCHAVALGGRIPRPKNTNNSTAGLDLLCSDLCQCLDGVCSFLPHNLADSCSRKRCLEYLVQYGGDLKTSTYGGKESTKDIAERCGKSSVVRMINEYCEFVKSHS